MAEGWKNNPTDPPILKIAERPPTLVKGLESGNYSELEFLQRVFSTPIKIHSQTTSFFDILKDITNTNLRGKKKLNKSAKKCGEVSETVFWRFFAMVLMENLVKRGKLKHLPKGLSDKVAHYIGVTRFRVFIIIYYSFLY